MVLKCKNLCLNDKARTLRFQLIKLLFKSKSSYISYLKKVILSTSYMRINNKKKFRIPLKLLLENIDIALEH